MMYQQLLDDSRSVIIFKGIKTDKDTKQTKLGKTFKPKILLVEDDIILQYINHSMLIDLGCEVDLAQNGYQALDQYHEEYDLVFLDIGLPDINGIRVCEILRKSNLFSKTKIIAYTAYGEDVAASCFAAGVDEFLIKPITVDDFQSMLIKWVPNYKLKK